LADLDPLRPLAGTGAGTKEGDEHPVAGGSERSSFVEHYDLRPIDPYAYGPQLFYGLRYHTHIVKPGEVETFHDLSATFHIRGRDAPFHHVDVTT
jgi:hypothetical protein